MSKKKTTKAANPVHQAWQRFSKRVDWAELQGFCNRTVQQTIDLLPFASKSKSTGQKRQRAADILAHIDPSLVKSLKALVTRLGHNMGEQITSYFDMPSRRDVAALEKQLQSLIDRLEGLDAGKAQSAQGASTEKSARTNDRLHPHA